MSVLVDHQRQDHIGQTTCLMLTMTHLLNLANGHFNSTTNSSVLEDITTNGASDIPSLENKLKKSAEYYLKETIIAPNIENSNRTFTLFVTSRLISNNWTKFIKEFNLSGRIYHYIQQYTSTSCY